MLTVPLKAVPGLAHAISRRRWPARLWIEPATPTSERDGDVAIEATRHPGGSAGWAAAMFPGARWVKALNTVYFKVLVSEAHRAGDRVGIPLASDDRAAMDIVASWCAMPASIR